MEMSSKQLEVWAWLGRKVWAEVRGWTAFGMQLRLPESGKEGEGGPLVLCALEGRS